MCSQSSIIVKAATHLAEHFSILSIMVFESWPGSIAVCLSLLLTPFHLERSCLIKPTGQMIYTERTKQNKKKTLLHGAIVVQFWSQSTADLAAALHTGSSLWT